MPLDWCDALDEDPDVLRRSWLFPVLNCTKSGDEGCDGRLGDEFAWLRLDGEDGRLFPLFCDSVRCKDIGSGLPSKEGWEFVKGVWTVEEETEG